MIKTITAPSKMLLPAKANKELSLAFVVYIDQKCSPLKSVTAIQLSHTSFPFPFSIGRLPDQGFKND
ncbi:hypothetical protein [Marinobacter nauticus]|uniref:hypothetical protein n=1 Tax=Marinobacter nauticus TaxID=2743 RepID=UPI004044C852